VAPISRFLMWFCNWADFSFFGSGVRNSAWLFPSIEIFHLLALGILGGTILLVNARLLGLRFVGEPVSELAKDVQPWMYGSLGVVLTSGFFSLLLRVVEDVRQSGVSHQDGRASPGYSFFFYTAREDKEMG